jgi:hypothetical protein
MICMQEWQRWLLTYVRQLAQDEDEVCVVCVCGGGVYVALQAYIQICTCLPWREYQSSDQDSFQA